MQLFNADGSDWTGMVRQPQLFAMFSQYQDDGFGDPLFSVDGCFATFSFAYESVVSSLSEIHKLVGFH